MTGADRDPRITELLERHTPRIPGEPDWDRVRDHGRSISRPLLAGAAITATALAAITMFLVAPGGDDGPPAPPGAITAGPRQGTPVPLPGALAPLVRRDLPGAPQTGLRPDTVRRILALRRGYGTWVLWTALDGSGAETAYLRDPRDGAITSVPLSGCRLTPRRPDLLTCRVGRGYAVGRAADRVVRIEPAGGTIVAGGWFLVLLPRSSPGPVPHRALDASGRELGRVRQVSP